MRLEVDHKGIASGERWLFFVFLVLQMMSMVLLLLLLLLLDGLRVRGLGGVHVLQCYLKSNTCFTPNANVASIQRRGGGGGGRGDAVCRSDCGILQGWLCPHPTIPLHKFKQIVRDEGFSIWDLRAYPDDLSKHCKCGWWSRIATGCGAGISRTKAASIILPSPHMVVAPLF